MVTTAQLFWRDRVFLCSVEFILFYSQTQSYGVFKHLSGAPSEPYQHGVSRFAVIQDSVRSVCPTLCMRVLRQRSSYSTRISGHTKNFSVQFHLWDHFMSELIHGFIVWTLNKKILQYDLVITDSEQKLQTTAMLIVLINKSIGTKM